MSVKSRRSKKIIFGVVLLAIGIILFIFKAGQSSENGLLEGKSMVVYRSATCGCCVNYISYLRHAGAKVEEKIVDNTDEINRQFGVPDSLASCHTTVVDNYAVVGHIPVEAVAKLLAEKPTVAGIALPNMPSGSPGMPGKKFGAFDIYSFTSANSYSPYLSL